MPIGASAGSSEGGWTPFGHARLAHPAAARLLMTFARRRARCSLVKRQTSVQELVASWRFRIPTYQRALRSMRVLQSRERDWRTVARARRRAICCRRDFYAEPVLAS